MSCRDLFTNECVNTTCPKNTSLFTNLKIPTQCDTIVDNRSKDGYEIDDFSKKIIFLSGDQSIRLVLQKNAEEEYDFHIQKFSSNTWVSLFVLGNESCKFVGHLLPSEHDQFDVGFSDNSWRNAHFTEDVTCRAVTTTSDERLKTNITNLTNEDSDNLLKLKAVRYNWCDEVDSQKINNKDGMDIGVLAQDVEKFFPSLVKMNETGQKSVNYQGLIPVILKFIQEKYPNDENK